MMEKPETTMKSPEKGDKSFEVMVKPESTRVDEVKDHSFAKLHVEQANKRQEYIKAYHKLHAIEEKLRSEEFENWLYNRSDVWGSTGWPGRDIAKAIRQFLGVDE